MSDSCPDLQSVSESESDPSDGSSSFSDSSDSDSDAMLHSDSEDQCSSDGTFDDEIAWQRAYKQGGTQDSLCLTNLKKFACEGDIPSLLRALPNEEFPEGERMLNIA